jgi:hypothetical protein
MSDGVVKLIFPQKSFPRRLSRDVQDPVTFTLQIAFLSPTLQGVQEYFSSINFQVDGQSTNLRNIYGQKFYW